ncbi:MAG TPA: NADH-quinone oxidoreductase subunit L [Polyangiaceae bacterium]
MQQLLTLFPQNDLTLLAFIVLLPLIGAAVNGIFGKRLGRDAVTLMGLSAIAGSFILSLCCFLMLADLQHGEQLVRFSWKGWEWVKLSAPRDAGTFRLSVGLTFDALNGVMALVVTGVGFLIHLYSWKYMEEDAGYYRFFAYLNLFIFSMLVLILGNSLPVLFVGWEGVGLCSYLLIGFWFEDGKNAAAGKKAFIANRVGDFGLLVAMGLLVAYVGALDWNGLEEGRDRLLQSAMQVFPAVPWIGLKEPIYASPATLVGLALFLGCAGKSAQLPLYVWLPDAMAGPTPVSALIHAATMVTAGVYLVCRLSFLFVLSPIAMFTVAFVGALTAVFAATIAFAQTDIKKVLAYSTVSQLGYMFLGAGVGAFTAGFFHVITHAFFKACLFLGAGSVIHAMHARIHDSDASQDMSNMGGLRKYMPITFWTFAASWAAIVGVPLTSGFFSKDAILVEAFTSGVKLESMTISAGRTAQGGEAMTKLLGWPEWGGPVLYVLGLTGAVFTAFYMTRLFIGIFFGEFKGWTIVKRWKDPGHGHGHGHHDHVEPGKPLEGPVPHESPWQMWVPLAILGGLAIVAGFLNAHPLGLHAFDHWLEPVFEHARESVQKKEMAEVGFIAAAVVAFAAGAGGAYWVYVLQRGEPALAFTQAWPRLHQLVKDKWRIDELYEETFIGAVDALAELSVWVDKWVVDGIIARFSAFVVSLGGTVLRYAQTGRVQAYALVMVLGLGGLGWFFFAPHAEARITRDHAKGAYSVAATPGPGYAYRWDENGDGKWDNENFGSKREISFALDPDQTRNVRFEVRNAFGRTSTREVAVQRPKPREETPTGRPPKPRGPAQPTPPPPGFPRGASPNEIIQ